MGPYPETLTEKGSHHLGFLTQHFSVKSLQKAPKLNPAGINRGFREWDLGLVEVGDLGILGWDLGFGV